MLSEDPAATALPNLEPVLDSESVLAMQQLAETIKFGDALTDYLLRIVHETRKHESLEYGVSPRGGIAPSSS